MKSCFKKLSSKAFDRLLKPLKVILKQITPLLSSGDRPLRITILRNTPPGDICCSRLRRMSLPWPKSHLRVASKRAASLKP